MSLSIAVNLIRLEEGFFDVDTRGKLLRARAFTADTFSFVYLTVRIYGNNHGKGFLNGSMEIHRTTVGNCGTAIIGDLMCFIWSSSWSAV